MRGARATTLEMRGGQATIIGEAPAVTRTQHRKCENLLRLIVFMRFSIVLLGSSKSECLPVVLARIRAFEGPEHAPGTSTGARIYAVVQTQTPCVLRSGERRTRRRAEEKKTCSEKRVYFIPGT